MPKKRRKKHSIISPELLQLQSDFSNWRKQKKNSKEKIPEELMARTFAQLSNCTASVLCTHLGLNYTDFNKKHKAFKTIVPEKPVLDFVELDLFRSPSSFSSELQYLKPDGTTLHLNLKDTSITIIQSLVSDFLGITQ